MKRFILPTLIVFFALALPSITHARSYRSSSSDVYVHGYYRSNGTYVQPHCRSAPDGIVSNNYSCIDDGKCGSSGVSSYVPVFIPTSTPIIIPDNPVSAGNILFNQMDQKPYYTVHISWLDTEHRGYSIALSKYAGGDPGPNTDTTASDFTFKNVSPGKWYVNLKSKIGAQWSKVTYFTVDIPPWTLPTPTVTPTSTSMPSPILAINGNKVQSVLGVTSDNSELNIWGRIKLIIYMFL